MPQCSMLCYTITLAMLYYNPRPPPVENDRDPPPVENDRTPPMESQSTPTSEIVDPSEEISH